MNAKKQNMQSEKQNEENSDVKPRYCGIIMPIAPMLPDYDATHWSRVKSILGDAIASADLVPRLVSESEEVGVIHGQIVQNLYDDEIVVCDVSGKNPNVMFELGMRLAFDKPTIIVQDDSNGYSFDIGPIKHIGYRKDQRFDDVEDFKDKVKTAITATLAKKQADQNFSPFLKHFGQFTPKTVEGHEIPQADYIMKKLASIEGVLRHNVALSNRLVHEVPGYANSQRYLEMRTPNEKAVLSHFKDNIPGYLRAIDKKDLKSMSSTRQAIKELLITEAANSDLTEERLSDLFDLAWDMIRKPDSYA